MLESAKWIKIGKDTTACPLFTKRFEIKKEVKKATAKMTAAGVYEAKLNGERVGNFFLAPGWTTYRFRTQVQEYDITSMLKEENNLEIVVGSGWYCGKITCSHTPKDPSLMILAEIEIEYADGTKDLIVTDNSWSSKESAIRYADIYDGEDFDANFVDEEPVSAIECDFPKTQLIAQEGEIATLQDELRPVRVIHTPKDEIVLDFGQEITGILRFTVNAQKGDVITLSCAEVLNSEGNFYRANYRAARAKMVVTCKEGIQTWQPTLTFYGFRYIKVEGWRGEIDLEAFRAIVACSELKRTGYLSSGHKKLNKLFENIIWGQRGNFLDVPTDCPQRDERFGWTGDAQVFIKTACYQYNVKKFFTKWLNDMNCEQAIRGFVPKVIPGVRYCWPWEGDDIHASPFAWGDAATICPWELYLHYGDKKLLAQYFDMMKNRVKYISEHTKDEYLWTKYYEAPYHDFGDWLALDNPEDKKGASNKDFLASAMYANSTELVCKSGKILGEDVSKYEELHKNIVAKFQETFTEYKTQSECALALQFNLAKDRKFVIERLVELIHDAGDHILSGFVGTPYMLFVLSQNGYTDLAYTLLLQESFPSWLYSVNKGATTVWEHWDGIKEDGTFWSPKMNSFNHYAYGSVAGWVYEEAAGIKPCEDAAGFARIRIEPKPDARIGWLRASVDTINGTIESEWSYEDDRVRYQIKTPVPATVVIEGHTYEVQAGTYLF